MQKPRQLLLYRGYKNGTPERIRTSDLRIRSLLPKSIRISISEDKRRFTPLARSSYKWDREYDKRTAVERVNSKLDVSYGFENHTIRGLKKMKLQCSLSLIVMLAMAVGRIKKNKKTR